MMAEHLCACGCGELLPLFIRGHTTTGMGYTSIHKWVRTQKNRTGFCSECGIEAGFGRSGTQWHNIDHEYRANLNDYIELCIPCHRVKNREILNRRKEQTGSFRRTVSV